MPNHVTNALFMEGAEKDIAQILSLFSTHYPSVNSKTMDGRLNYNNSDGEWGRFDKAKNKFTIDSNNSEHEGVPSEWEPLMEEAWTRFPDFEKVKPEPESMDIDIGSKITDAVDLVTGGVDFKAGFESLSSRNSVGEMDIVKMISQMKFNRTIKDLIENQNNMLSFSDEELDLFTQAIKNKRDHGHAYRYSYRRENWGTKWNAYECHLNKDLGCYIFQTAWSSVEGIILEMSSQFPDVRFLYKWADEDTGSNVGSLSISNGAVVERESFENESKEAYELAFELNPDSLESIISLMLAQIPMSGSREMKKSWHESNNSWRSRFQ